MPDITITITAEEVTILESFFATAEEGLLEASRGQIKRGACNIINQSTSQLDPRKLSNAELRTEIARLDGEGEIPSYADRQL
jgi:hypothetical protein